LYCFRLGKESKVISWDIFESVFLLLEAFQVSKVTVVDLHAVLELPIRDQLCPEVDVDFNSAESLELVLSFIGISKLLL
jgi:hypothetical protein